MNLQIIIFRSYVIINDKAICLIVTSIITRPFDVRIAISGKRLLVLGLVTLRIQFCDLNIISD